MSKNITLKIVTPKGIAVRKQSYSITLPGMEGQFTILPDHMPTITKLKKGDIVINDTNESFAIEDGFFVLNDNQCVITLNHNLDIKREEAV